MILAARRLAERSGARRDAEADLAAGMTIGQICQKLEISEATFNRWRNQYGGMKGEEMKRLKELEQENRRLKGLVADLSLDNQILKEYNRVIEEGKV